MASLYIAPTSVASLATFKIFTMYSSFEQVVILSGKAWLERLWQYDAFFPL